MVLTVIWNLHFSAIKLAVGCHQRTFPSVHIMRLDPMNLTAAFSIMQDIFQGGAYYIKLSISCYAIVINQAGSSLGSPYFCSTFLVVVDLKLRSGCMDFREPIYPTVV